MPAKLEEITARFLRERIRWDETVVAEAYLANGSQGNEDSDNWVSLKGKAEAGELAANQTYRFYGRWTEYPNKRTGKKEKQFAFQTFVECQPAGKAGVIAYLCRAGQGNGLGRGRARQLWESHGSDAVRFLREEPESAAAEIKGLSIEQAKQIAEWLRDKQALESCMIELTDLLDGRELPRDTARRAVQQWGNLASQMIRRDPYQLMAFRGCGFKRCDQLWLDLGLPPERLRRQALCAWYAVASDTEGHTWHTADFAVRGLAGQVPRANIRPGAALRMAKRIGRLSPDRHGALAIIRSSEGGQAIVRQGGKPWVAEGRKAANEELLAELVVRSLDEAARWPVPLIENESDITDHQVEQLNLALGGTVGILGGSPGTGKTYAAAKLIKRLMAVFGSHQIAIGCPTGKAAVRISEAMAAAGVPLRARTWHSLLGVEKSPDESGSWRFKHREDNPLPHKVLIGDESSMLDTNLMTSIMRARAAGTHLFLVGDINQLPPVGHGAPLRDLIAAGLPYGELREIMRNSGGIAEACAAIRDGQPWQPGDNLRIISALSPAKQIEAITEELAAMQHDGSFDPVWDCQVVVPVNSKSQVSRKELNRILQEELNSNPGIPGQPFRLGDKIVNYANGYYPAVCCDIEDEDIDFDGSEVYVANGELAEAIEVQDKIMIAGLLSPDRTIKIPRGRPKESDDETQSSTGCSWELSYALSVHKAQGSEWPVVIVVIDEYPGAKMICSREWLYTAISRAKQKCILIGRKSTADSFCRRVAIGNRKTFLREQILRKQAERVLVEL